MLRPAPHRHLRDGEVQLYRTALGDKAMHEL
jgi:hypothetical protein